jgi:hypothetical protein
MTGGADERDGMVVDLNFPDDVPWIGRCEIETDKSAIFLS